jgi:hypothetical protein
MPDVTLVWDEPTPNCVLWRFHGLLGRLDYLPLMNESITRAMLAPDEPFAVLLDMRWAMLLPNRSFKLVARPIIAAPPNLKRVVIAAPNPFTRLLLALTLGREPLLTDRLAVVGSRRAAEAIVRADLS